jgi:3-oxoacyl-[acyl-carrier-protein] synthase-3
VPNDHLARIMDTSDEWIQVRTGIEERHFAAAGEASSDLALPAARDAIADAGLAVEDIDYLVFATMTPDFYFPGSGAVLQHKLGLGEIPCLDIRQQCAGYVYGLQLADALIRSGGAKNVLVVGAEVHSCFMPWESWDVLLGQAEGPIPDHEWERNTATRDRTVLFGDGAGATVVSVTEADDRGILDTLLHTNGAEVRRLWTQAGGSAFRPYFDPEMVTTGEITPMVEGRKVYALAVTFMPKVTVEILERNRLTTDDLDLVIMHQANLRINEGVQKRLGLPDHKVFNNIQRYGNTTAGTIPIAIHDALREGKLKSGDLVCLVGLGSGLNWGAALVRF